MKFSVPRANVVLSDEGFSVEVLGRTGIQYREHERAVFVDSEILACGGGIAVFTNSIGCWLPPHEQEPISAEDRERIGRNIRLALEFQGARVQLS